MGKGQYEATKGMSYKDIYTTRFLPDLMDKIGDPDKYQDIYDKVFKKGRFIEGYTYNEEGTKFRCSCLEIDKDKMSNLDLLFGEWYNDSDAFDKSLDLLIRIAKEDDKEALKIKDNYLKTHPYRKSHLEEKEEEEEKKKNKEKPKEVVVQEPVGEAAYTQTAQDQVASSMAANNIPEQNIYNSTVHKPEEERSRVEFTSQFFEDNRDAEPENAATFHHVFPDGRVMMPDGTVHVDPSILMQNRPVYPMQPMTQQVMQNVNMYVPMQYGGIPYQPEYFNIESDSNVVDVPFEPIQESNQNKPVSKAPEYIIDNRIIPSNDKGEDIPWCEFLMDSAAVYNARVRFNNDEIFIPASKTATGLIKRKNIIREIYHRTGMVSGLFSFKYINTKSQFGIWMCTCNNTWLTIDYVNGAYSFTEEVPARQ